MIDIKHIFLSWVVILLMVSHSEAAVDTVPVLMYHDITVEKKEYGETVISVDAFEAQMQYLHENGYQTLTIAQLIEFMKGERALTEKSVVITIDDGWLSTLNAIPILERYQFQASVWVLSDAEAFSPNYLTMEQVKQLDQHPLIEIGCHTATHPWNPEDSLLTWLENKPEGRGHKDIIYELETSKTKLEELLGREINYLAWPCGWHNDQLVAMAKDAGYEALLTTYEVFNHVGDDVFHIRRFFIDGKYDLKYFQQILEVGLATDHSSLQSPKIDIF